ncbi:hypothetical protein [Rhizorhabdus sp.]|uniref:hypothetical protein n=1 Tax=Rhizorhabdus sp. TaxID=1968843 RepID=UPI0035B12F8A
MAAREVARRDDVANAEEMAKILKMTWRNLRLIIDADAAFPIQSRGAEGIAWEFRVAKVLDHLIKRCRSEIQANSAKHRRLAELAGVSVPEDADGMSLADLRQINLLQMDAQRRKMDQGEWVPRAQVQTLFTSFFSMVQSEHQSTAAKIDPTGRLPAEVRAAVQDHMRGLLVRLHDKFGAFISDDVPAASQSRTRVPRARSGSVLRQRA